MKLTLAEILVARDAILKFEKLPGKVAYRLGVLAADLGDQCQIIENVRNDLIKKYGKPDERTGQPVIKVGTPEMQKFSDEYAELLNQEIDFPFADKINLPDTITIEPIVLFNLRKFIEVI